MCEIVLDPNDYPELHFGEPRKKKKTFTEIRNDPSVSKLPVQPYRSTLFLQKTKAMHFFFF